MGKLRLPILVEMDEDGYYMVSCPLFKGCHSYGRTIDEALENMREVIEMCLEETSAEDLNRFVGFRELEVSQNAQTPSCQWERAVEVLEVLALGWSGRRAHTFD